MILTDDTVQEQNYSCYEITPDIGYRGISLQWIFVRFHKIKKNLQNAGLQRFVRASRRRNVPFDGKPEKRIHSKETPTNVQVTWRILGSLLDIFSTLKRWPWHCSTVVIEELNSAAEPINNDIASESFRKVKDWWVSSGCSSAHSNRASTFPSHVVLWTDYQIKGF